MTVSAPTEEIRFQKVGQPMNWMRARITLMKDGQPDLLAFTSRIAISQKGSVYVVFLLGYAELRFRSFRYYGPKGPNILRSVRIELEKRLGVEKVDRFMTLINSAIDQLAEASKSAENEEVSAATMQ